MRWTRRILTGIAIFSAFHTTHGEIQITRDGTATSEIVVPEDALSSVMLAANDLQTHIKLISGAALTIVTNPTPAVPTHIYVGESKYTKALGLTTTDLKVEGFKIVARDGFVALIGHDEQRRPFPYGSRRDGKLAKWQEFAGAKYAIPSVGPSVFQEELGFYIDDATATLYAVSDFLEQLGVRWYHPYENGTIIPHRKNIIVPEQEVRKEPAFPYRTFTYYNWMRRDAAGILWFKRLKYGASYSYLAAHNTRDIITPEQRELHPEYFAMADGKPITGHSNGGVPRLCDPGFRQTSINYLEKTFAAYPPLVAMSLGMPDGFTKIDERDARIWSGSGRGYNGKFSDYVWDYWLDMADRLQKARPDKYLACIAYTTFLEPPSQVTVLPGNVTVHIAYQAQTLHLPQGTALKRLRDQWLAMLTSKKLYVFNHYLFYRAGGPRYPVIFTKLLQQDMQDLHGVCEGKFVEVAPNVTGPDKGRLACPGLTHMLHYLQGKLYWDPDLDLQVLLDEYYDLYFGPASAEMKAFYEFAEEVWMRPETRSISSVSGFLTQGDVDRYFEILARARRKTNPDSVYDRRIAEIESEMQPLKTLMEGLKRTGPDFEAFVASQPFTLDGNLDNPLWSEGGIWYPMRDLITGEAVPDAKSTRVSFRLTTDKTALLIGVKCFEPDMDKIIADAKNHDDFDIFNGDIVEIYLETPERSFFKICVDPNGHVWDESQDVTIVERDTTPTLWEPGTRAVVHRSDNGWTAEILIPTQDFGSKGPDAANPWGVNVGRARWAEEGIPCYAISPTGRKQFQVLSKLGNLRLEGE